MVALGVAVLAWPRAGSGGQADVAPAGTGASSDEAAADAPSLQAAHAAALNARRERRRVERLVDEAAPTGESTGGDRPEGPRIEPATALARVQLTLRAADGGALVAGAAPTVIELRDLERGTARTLTLEGATAEHALRVPAGTLELVAWTDSEVAGPLKLTLAPAEERDATLQLRPAGSVTGRIVDSLGGEPVPGARVRFWTFSEEDVATTDAHGTFRHPRFPTGTDLHQLQVEAPGYGSLVRYLSFDADGSWALYSDLTAAPAAQGRDGRPWVELALPRETVLRGQVVDRNGRPVAGAQVLAEGYVRALDGVATRDAAEGETDEEGRFHLVGLRADVGHGLRIHARGSAVVSLEAERGREDLGRIELPLGRTVAGTVLDPAGQPREHVTVELVDAARAPAEAHSARDAALRLDCVRRQAKTDVHGTFVFEDAPDRALLVRVVEDGHVLAKAELTHGEAGGLVLQTAPVLDPGPRKPIALARSEAP